MPDSEIIAHEDALRRAMLAGDVAALDRLIDDDLAFVTHTGDVIGKAMDLETHASGTLKLRELTPSEVRVRDYGNVAVVTVRMAVAGTYEGAAFRDDFRYMRVWHRGDAGWRVVVGQMSVVRPQSSLDAGVK